MNWRAKSTGNSLPLSRPATQLAEIMAKVALELEARSDQGPSGDRSSTQEACRAQRDPRGARRDASAGHLYK
jgi:hypothetical protein